MAQGRATYCNEADVKLYYMNVRLNPEGFSLSSAIEAACDEADGYIGVRYMVPIAVSESDPDKRHASTFLKTATAQLTAGRIITSAATGGERTTVHDYGKYLINSALVTLRAIRDGNLDIPFADKPTEEINRKLGPMILGDRYSQVDNFYQNYEPYGLVPSWDDGGETPWQSRLQ